MNLTIKELPNDIHALLKQRAEETGRSLNKFVIHTLTKSLQPTPIDRSALLAEIRDVREASSQRLGSPEEVEAAIESGRE